MVNFPKMFLFLNDFCRKVLPDSRRICKNDSENETSGKIYERFLFKLEFGMFWKDPDEQNVISGVVF